MDLGMDGDGGHGGSSPDTWRHSHGPRGGGDPVFPRRSLGFSIKQSHATAPRGLTDGNGPQSRKTPRVQYRGDIRMHSIRRHLVWLVVAVVGAFALGTV